MIPRIAARICLIVSGVVGLAAFAIAAPIVPQLRGQQVAIGRFMTWYPAQRAWDFVSGGVRVAIAPLPCDGPRRSEACAFEKVDNQARVTVSAPGLAPFVIETDPQASYYRIAVVRFAARDRRPGMVIENDSGGSAGIVTVFAVVPVGDTFRRIDLDPDPARYVLEGTIADFPRDLSGDGVTDFVLRDGRFGNAFGCNACTPRPPLVLNIGPERGVDVSRAPGFASVFRADLAADKRICASLRMLRNGACVAYAADAARLGRFEPAMRDVARWYERNDQWGNGTGFPARLRAFLIKTGYVR